MINNPTIIGAPEKLRWTIGHFGYTNISSGSTTTTQYFHIYNYIPRDAINIANFGGASAFIYSAYPSGAVYPPTANPVSLTPITSGADRYYKFSASGKRNSNYLQLRAILITTYTHPNINVEHNDDGTMNLTGTSDALDFIFNLDSSYEQTSSAAFKLVDLSACVSMQTIGSCACLRQSMMTRFIAPPNLQKISSKAFYGCSGLQRLDFSGSTRIPTLENVDALTDVPAECEILVPSNLYDGWVTSENWSSFADQIVQYQG